MHTHSVHDTHTHTQFTQYTHMHVHITHNTQMGALCTAERNPERLHHQIFCGLYHTVQIIHTCCNVWFYTLAQHNCLGRNAHIFDTSTYSARGCVKSYFVLKIQREPHCTPDLLNYFCLMVFFCLGGGLPSRGQCETSFPQTCMEL